MERKFNEYQEKMQEIHDTLVGRYSELLLLLIILDMYAQLKYQEAAELLARKAHISSEEARLQAEKALEIETQLERCKYEITRVSCQSSV